MPLDTALPDPRTSYTAPEPRAWRTVRFGDVVSNVDAYEREPLQHGIDRYVGLEHLDPESLHIARWGLVAEGTSFSRKFVRGQVLFGKRRAYQRKAAIAEFDGICSGDILVLQTKNEDLLPELLPFIVQSDGFVAYALQTSAGSLSPRTRWRDLAEYEFALPPLDDQRRIAEILWAADETESKYQESSTAGEQVRRNLLPELVLRGLNTSNLIATPAGDLPQHWDVTRIGDAGSVQGGRQRAPQYHTGAHTHPYLRVANVYDGYLDLSDVLRGCSIEMKCGI